MFGLMLGLLLAQVSPSPSVSPTSSPCSHDADVVKAAFAQPTEPSDQDLFAIVAVRIAPDGTIETAKIYRSSGNLYFDQASVIAARHSTYKPKVVDCKPVEGIVYFKTSLTGGYPPGPRDNPTPPPWPKDVTPPPAHAAF